MQEFSMRLKTDVRSKIELLTPLYLIKKHILQQDDKKDVTEDEADQDRYSCPSSRPFMGKMGFKATENITEED